MQAAMIRRLMGPVRTKIELEVPDTPQSHKELMESILGFELEETGSTNDFVFYSRKPVNPK